MSRGIEGMGTTATGFWFLCDCATRTEVTFESGCPPANEFAITCRTCQAVHWFQPKAPPPPDLPDPPVGATWPGAGPHTGHTITLIEAYAPVGRVRCSCTKEWSTAGMPYAWDPPRPR